MPKAKSDNVITRPSPGAPSANPVESALGERLLRHKRRPVEMLVNVEEASALLAGDVAIALGEDVDELSTHQADFRQGIQRILRRLLKMVLSHEERVSFFNEAVPGFTLMVFKKEPLAVSGCAPLPREDLSSEMAAASVMIEQFFKRTGSRVLAVEGVDVVCVFFPATDVKRNLRELGFYLVD